MICPILLTIFILFMVWKIFFGISDYNDCYDTMRKDGNASFGTCKGSVGGDKMTGFLSETCIGCPYYKTERRWLE